MDVLVDRVAGLDIGKARVAATVRTPGEGRSRREVTRMFATFAADLGELREWLLAEGVTDVVMEATSDYWKPVWWTLEVAGFDLMLVNARDVHQLPGRKTDVADSAWLAQLLECRLLRSSFVPPKEIRQLRDLTRYRKRLVQDRTREAQRVEKVLEDTGIKLSVVASSVLSKSARAMIDALIAGEAIPVFSRIWPKVGCVRRSGSSPKHSTAASKNTMRCSSACTLPTSTNSTRTSRPSTCAWTS